MIPLEELNQSPVWVRNLLLSFYRSEGLIAPAQPKLSPKKRMGKRPIALPPSPVLAYLFTTLDALAAGEQPVSNAEVEAHMNVTYDHRDVSYLLEECLHRALRKRFRMVTPQIAKHLGKDIFAVRSSEKRYKPFEYARRTHPIGSSLTQCTPSNEEEE